MKPCHKVCIFLFPLLISNSFSLAENEKSLKDIYKTGKVKFIRELSIIDDSLPEEIYFQNPRDVAISRDGEIFVSDYDGNNIKKFSPDGKFLKIIGRKGEGPGDLSGPSYLETNKDRLIVWESRNGRFSLFNLEGDFIKSIQFPWVTGLLWDLGALPDGRIIIDFEKTDLENREHPQERRIELCSFDMEHIETIYSKKLFRTKRITKPVTLSVPQPWNPNVFWDVTPEGKIVVGFSEKYEIEVYDPVQGKLFSFDHKYKPVEVNKKDKETFFSIFTITFIGADGQKERKTGAPDYIIKNTEFPKFKPAFNSIMVDSEGNIWVHANRKKGEEENKYFDVFNERGEFINNVKILGETDYPFYRFSRIVNRCFWKIETDEEGFFSVVKYRISD